MKWMFAWTLLALFAVVPVLPAVAQEKADNLAAGATNPLDPSAGPPAADPAPAGPPPFTASLLLVKADWSQVPEAKEIAAELLKALEGVPVPQELLDKLPASGPQILFPPEIVSQYSSQHYAELLAWLKAKGLVEKVMPFSQAAAEIVSPAFLGFNPGDDDATASQAAEAGKLPPGAYFAYKAHLTAPYDMLDLPPISTAPSQPFVTREPEFYWNVYYEDNGGEHLYVQRELVPIERVRGRTPKRLDPLDQSLFEIFKPARGQVAVANAFPSSGEGTFRMAARRRGYEVLIVIAQGPPDKQLAVKRAAPRLVLPDEVNTLAVRRAKVHQWPVIGTAVAEEPNAVEPAAAADKSPAAEDSPLKMIVFDLKHANAGSVKDMLFLLFQHRIFSGELDFGAEPSVNRLIVRGSPKDIEEIAALLKQIDRPIAAGNKSGQPSEGDSSAYGDVGMSESQLPAASREVLQKQYDSLEKHAAELAGRLRDKEGSSPGGRQPQSELRKVVAQAFAARQRLHQVELAALEERLKATRETLVLRERIEDAVIERRVEELLNPALRWESVPEGQPPSVVREISKIQQPSVDGVVLSVDKKRELATISAGSDDGIRKGATLHVYRDVTHLGRVAVVSTTADTSLVRIEEEDSKAPIRVGDRVLDAYEATPLAPKMDGGSGQTGAQLYVGSPQGATMSWMPRSADGKSLFTVPSGRGVGAARKTLPARFTVTTGETVAFSLSEIPGREELRLCASVEIAPLSNATATFVARDAIPVEIADEDLDQAASGNLVVKVAYLPRVENPAAPSGEVQTLVSTRLDPGVDPVVEAQRRGHVLSVLRLGNRTQFLGANEERGPRTEIFRRQTPGVKEHLYQFRPNASPEHRKAVFEQLKAYPDLAARMHTVGPNHAITFYARDEEVAVVIALLKELDLKQLDRKPPTDAADAPSDSPPQAAPDIPPPRDGASAWPLFRGNPQMTGMAASSLPANLALLWSFRVKDGAFEVTAAIASGMAYIGDLDGKLYALDMNTGQKQWEFVTDDELVGFSAGSAMRDGLLYIGDVNGKFYCLNADEGKPVWSFQTEGEISSSPNFYKDNVLIGSQDGTLYCLNAKSGELVWKIAIGDQIRCSPTIAGNRGFLAGCDSRLHIIDLESGDKVADVPIDGPTGVTPAVRGDLVFLGAESGTFYAVDWKKAEVAWKWEGGSNGLGIRSSAAVTESLLLFGGRDKRLHALDPATGKEKWSFLTRGKIDSSPVVSGTRAYFGSADGRLYAVDLATGEKAWEYEASGRFLGSPAVVAGKLMIASDDGVVYCFGAKE